MNDDRTVHFEAENHGSIWRFIPLTDAARAWVEEHLPADRMEFPSGVVVIEHRFIGNIIEGAANDGLRVRVL